VGVRRRDVHRLRAECDTIVVGIGTVLADDPHLSVRDADGSLVGAQPLRVVVDTHGRTPGSARVLDDSAPTWVATAAELGTGPDGGVDLGALMKDLWARERTLVLLEGGPTLAGAFVRADLVDRLVVYLAPSWPAPASGPSPTASPSTSTTYDGWGPMCGSPPARDGRGADGMFTGIVEELGEVTGLADLGDSVRLSVHGPLVVQDAARGDSVSVNGVCLTVVEATAVGFTADVMRETLDRSALGALVPGARVNLERPVRLDGRLGGHLVQGHVDGTGVILERTTSEHWDVVRVSLPADLARYVVSKGSVTVDGVSLTVASLSEGSFTVGLIPTTLELTTLGRKQVGDPVNLEVDVLAKYVERLLTARDEENWTRRTE